MQFVFRRFFPCLLLTFLMLTFACKRQAAPDQMTVVIEKKITKLDPRVSSDSADERFRQLVFNSLTRKNEKFEAVPALAASIDAAPDFNTFTFRLREGVQFHDGRTLTAQDVKYTFDTLLQINESAKRVELAQYIASIETPDAQTVVFHMKKPAPGFANMIVPCGIIPQGTGDTVTRTPIGTGPFKFVSFTEAQEVVLAAHENYFEGKPAINTLHVRMVEDGTTRDSELRKGSADLAINADFDPVTIEGLQKAEGLKVTISDGTNVAYLGLNVNDPILREQKVRQAIAYAIDREAIIRDLLRGQAKPASSILPLQQWAYEANTAKYDFNLAKASELLDAAGKKANGDQPRFKLTLKVSPVAIFRKTAEAIQEQLRKAGIAVELQTLESQKLTQDLTDGNFQMFLRIVVGGNQSPDIFRFLYHASAIPPNGQNRMRYNNPTINKLLDEAATASQEKQKEIFAQVQKTLADELPMIYLWYPSTVMVARDRVTGLNLDPSGDWSAIRNVKLTQ